MVMCTVVSLKPGHMDWVRDFDFMLNLFSFSSPYRPLWSYPRNRPLVNGWESQSLAAATIPQKSGHCICSTLKYVECTYVFKHKPELVKKVFMLYVFRVGLLNKLLLLWWCVTVMVMCYCYGDVLLLWWCVTLMVMCYSYGDVLLLWWCVTLMVMCYSYGDVLLLWWCVTLIVMCYCYGGVLLLWWCVTLMVMCYCYGVFYCYCDVLLLWWWVTVIVVCYCYGGVTVMVVLLLWWCVTVMVMFYCYGDMLLLWWCVTVMVMCYLHPHQASTRTVAYVKAPQYYVYT